MTDLIEPSFCGCASVVVAAAGTRVALGATACRTVVIKAKAANTGNIYVGGATVAAANGFPLQAGEVVSLSIHMLSSIYIDSDVNGEGVNIIYVS